MSSLKVFISSPVYVTIDPGTSSVVASQFCLVELWLAIFWAVFTRFSYASSRICSSVQNKEEPSAHYKNSFVCFELFKR